MQPQILRYLQLWGMLGSCGDKTSLPSNHDLQSNYLLLHDPKTWWLKTTTITILYLPWFGVDCAHPGKFLFSIYHAVVVKRWLGLQSSQKLLQLYDWPLMLAVRWDLSQHVASPITGHLLLDSAILENRNQSLVTQTLALKAIQG